MPMPNKGETKKEWLDRCMADPEENKTFPDSSQRYAVCNSKWDQHQKDQRRKRRRRRRGVMKHG
ncbi:MAG TPA: hypothetical protein VKA19_06490 [Alphaproteobacteria bacterium]|nr:hypothetical protein [Alphaproteobacteria bacterium]HKJ73749.1 hypothetical protein [Alphaproteobacteria bacterium]